MRTFTERGPTSDEATTRDALDPLGASHHFRMFFHCSLQSLGSSIERIANQVSQLSQGHSCVTRTEFLSRFILRRRDRWI